MKWLCGSLATPGKLVIWKKSAEPDYLLTAYGWWTVLGTVGLVQAATVEPNHISSHSKKNQT